MLIPNFKNFILKNVSLLPNNLNKFLLKLNNYPELTYGKKYIHYLKELKTVYYSKYDNIPDVLKVVNYAIKNVPYYTNKYGSKSLNTIQEFNSQIGFIDKNIIMRNPREFTAKNIDLNLYDKMTTGGTSGKPLSFIVPKNRYIVELGTMHFLWEKAGFNYQARAVLRNQKFKKGEDYKINPITKEFIFNNFNMNPDYVKKIYGIIKRNRIKIILAYPSAAYQFCLFCKEQGLNLSFIKTIFCASEGILDFQRKLMAEELGLNLYSYYGHSEKLVLGGYCEHTDNYHMEKRYGFFELIRDDGIPITTPGEVGEIVGTTLNNFGMPLIRYRTGDYAEYVGNYCDKCKRHLPIIKNVQGRREQNLIYKKDGTYITTTALNLHDHLYEEIDGLQYIQDRKGELRVLIIPNNKLTSKSEKSLYTHFKNAMGGDSEVVIEHVSKLRIQPNGKFLLLINNITNGIT